MSNDLEGRALQGRVFTAGVAQETSREGGTVRVRLFCLPGAADVQGAAARVAFPEPVQLAAGETLELSVEWVNGGPAPEGGSFRLAPEDTVTHAWLTLG